MSEAKARFSLEDGVLEFEGSEQFVAEQIEKFREAIAAGIAAQQRRPPSSPPPEKAPPASTPQPGGGKPAAGDFAEVFEPVGDNSVQILKDIPGNSKAEKTVNAGKLYLYGLELLRQRKTAYFHEIASVAKSHGFLDASNLSTNLKADNESFICSGAGRKQTIQLTVPGRKSAQNMVEELKVGGAE